MNRNQHRNRICNTKAADPIPFGTYTVKETVFPKDYRAYGKSEWTVTLNKNTPNATITIKAVNELIPGSAKIVKVSEDGKVDGITFRIQGNGIDKTVKTAYGGVIQVDNLRPGVYTVTEAEYDKYVPQEKNIEVLKTLKIHIGMGLTDEVTEDKTLDIQIRIAEIDAEFQKMLKAVSADNADGIDEERITELMNEKQRLTVQLEQYAAMRQKRESAKSRLDEIYTILDGLQNHPMEYDDKLVRQIIECVVVESKEKIKVIFIGGTEIEMTL